MTMRYGKANFVYYMHTNEHRERPINRWNTFILHFFLYKKAFFMYEVQFE